MTNVGTAYVTVVPVIDTDVLRELADLIDRFQAEREAGGKEIEST